MPYFFIGLAALGEEHTHVAPTGRRWRPCAAAASISSFARCSLPRRSAEAHSAETVKAMKPGAVIVDVSIDQGGTSETSSPTTHSHPTYVVDDVVHYCGTNMLGRSRAARVPLSARWAQRA
jgi:hypothetical protein